jgi:hypothetical protein
MKNLIKKILREDKDWDWAKDIKPLSMDGDYVLDVGDMGRQDYSILVDDLKDLGYDTTILPDSPYGIVRLRYIYLEYNEENGEYSTDWNDYQNQNPTYGGRYRMLTMEDFTELFYYWKMEKQVPFVMDRHLKEDKDWDFMGDINPIHEDGEYVIVVEGELSASDWEKMLDYVTHLGYNGDGHWRYDDLYSINNKNFLLGDEGNEMSLLPNEGVIFYLSKNYKGLKNLDWDNIKHLEWAKEKGYIPIMLDDFNEMGENHLKSLKEDKDWDFMGDINPLKGRGGVGYVALLYAEDTKGRFFIGDDGNIMGYPTDAKWKDVLVGDPDKIEQCIFRTKAEAQKAIREVKKWRNKYPGAKWYDNYSIEKI